MAGLMTVNECISELAQMAVTERFVPIAYRSVGDLLSPASYRPMP